MVCSQQRFKKVKSNFFEWGWGVILFFGGTGITFSPNGSMALYFLHLHIEISVTGSTIIILNNHDQKMTIIFILQLQFYFGLDQLIDPSVLSLGADFYVAIH